MASFSAIINRGNPGRPNLGAYMRAIVVQRFGGPEVLKCRERPQPTAGSGELLVRIHAAGVNPVDGFTRVGDGFASASDFPFIPGWDLSGVVNSVGHDVTTLRVGDEVYGMPRFPSLAGTYAQWIAAPADELALKPQG